MNKVTEFLKEERLQVKSAIKNGKFYNPLKNNEITLTDPDRAKLALLMLDYLIKNAEKIDA